jgi:hypothetical protein
MRRRKIQDIRNPEEVKMKFKFNNSSLLPTNPNKIRGSATMMKSEYSSVLMTLNQGRLPMMEHQSSTNLSQIEKPIYSDVPNKMHIPKKVLV